MANLSGLPLDLPVCFKPITGAYLGDMTELVAGDFNYYTKTGNSALPTDDGAYLSIYITTASDKENKAFIDSDCQ